MAVTKPYLEHLSSSDDLITPYEAIRAGFVAQALEKNRRATPFVAQARALKASASKAKTPTELVHAEDIQPALLTAAGVSDKATGHLQPHTFFIGAAIERSMANEIWGQLEEGTLENAANLTDDNQIASVSRWLCNL